MTNDQIVSIVKSLTDLGMYSGEAKTYIALYQGGTSEATPLATRAGISQPKIYGFLTSLEVKGFISKTEINGKPNQYIALNFRLVLKELQNEFQAKIDQTGDYFDQLIVQQGQDIVKDFVKITKGDNPVRLALRGLVAGTAQNLYILPNEKFSPFLNKLENEYPSVKFIYITEKFVKFKNLIEKLAQNLDPKFSQIFTRGRPLVIFQDVDPVSISANLVSIVTPQSNEFDPVLFQIHHPLIVNFQTGLLIAVMDILENQLPRIITKKSR